MSSDLIGVFLIHAALYAVCFVIWVWSRHSASQRLALVLRYSAPFWAVWLTLSSAALYFVTLQCAGNWLYGYTDCQAISDDMGNLASAVTFLSWAAGIIFGGVLMIGGGIWEGIARSRT